MNPTRSGFGIRRVINFERIEEFFRFLQNNPTLKVSIEGHTDNIGNGTDN